MARPRRAAFTLIELLVVIAIIAVLVALLVPAVQKVRDAANRTECLNNLKQIGLGLHGFYEANKLFPASGYTGVAPGNPNGKAVGWRPIILPHLEQETLHSIYNFTLDWWVGTNQVAAAVPIRIFQCPSVPHRDTVTVAPPQGTRTTSVTFPNPIAPTDYEAIMGVQPSSFPGTIYNAKNRFAIMHRNARVKMIEVVDGTSNTIMVGETAARPTVYRLSRPDPSAPANSQGIGWADSEGPYSLDGASADGTQEGCGHTAACSFPMNRKNDNEPFSFHSGGANFVFADGHVSFITESIPILTFAALCTRAAEEPVQWNE